MKAGIHIDWASTHPGDSFSIDFQRSIDMELTDSVLILYQNGTIG